MSDTPPCRACGKSDSVICYPDDHSLAICPDCCAKVEHLSGETGHVFEYDRGERDHVCTECGLARSCTDYAYEPMEGDVPIMTAREFLGDRPLGTPASQLSGRPGHPGYEEFCRIAKSWGYE